MMLCVTLSTRLAGEVHTPTCNCVISFSGARSRSSSEPSSASISATALHHQFETLLDMPQGLTHAKMPLNEHQNREYHMTLVYMNSLRTCCKC